MPIRYVTGDATEPQGAGHKMLLHVCTDAPGWGAGFVVAVSRRWPEPERAYRAWSRTSEFVLGAVQFVPVASDITVANMLAQHGYRNAANPVALRYEALTTCLTTVAEHATAAAATVHMPRIGCGLAGGTWSRIERIVQQTLVCRGIDTTVYDLPAANR